MYIFSYNDTLSLLDFSQTHDTQGPLQVQVGRMAGWLLQTWLHHIPIGIKTNILVDSAVGCV